MQVSELQRLRKLGSGIVGFTAFVVMVLATWLYSSASSMPESTSTVKALSARRRVITPDRSIASVPDMHGVSREPETNINAKVDAKIETVLIGCPKDVSHFEVQSNARHVRLKMAACHNGSAVTLDHSQIVNIANGYEGTLFILEKGGFSSDYIHLVDGENKLMVKVEDLKGHEYASEITIFHR